MYFVDRTAVVLKPTARFLEWLKSADENMPDLTIEQLRANCSVFLVPQFDEPEAVIAYFDERYQQIFEAELAGWDIDKLMNDGTFSNLSKRELLQITRQRAKLEKNLGSISDLTRLPSALFVIDVMKEHIAIKEAQRLGIPVFAIVDTNSDPRLVDYVIPANDDAKDSIDVILTACCSAIAEGLTERKLEKADEKAAAEQAEVAADAKPKRARKTRKEEAPATEQAEAKTEE